MMDELLEEMIDPEPSRQDVARRRRAWATGSILVLAAVGVTSLTTAALFTDQDSVSGTVGTGTLVLGLDPDGEGLTFDVDVAGLAPGDVVDAPLTVRNDGSLALRYAISVSSSTAPAPDAGADQGSGDLRTQLRASILQGACPADGQTPTVLGATNAPGTYGLPTDVTPLVGSVETGADQGDRELAGASGVDLLCVRLELSQDADNTFQNTAATLTLQFDSEQTVNNP